MQIRKSALAALESTALALGKCIGDYAQVEKQEREKNCRLEIFVC